MQARVHRFGHVAAPRRVDVAQVVRELLDIGREVPGTGHICVATVPESHQAEARRAAPRQLLDALRDAPTVALILSISSPMLPVASSKKTRSTPTLPRCCPSPPKA